MKPSGNPITRAPLRPASRIRRQAFSVDPSRSRKTEAACTAATFTTPYTSPIGCRRRLLLRGLARRGLAPVVAGALRTLERVGVLKAWRHRGAGAGEDLMMLDIERAQPALLAHRER